MTYEEKYAEVLKALNISDTHSHEQVLIYIRQHKEKQWAAEKVLAATRTFGSSLQELGCIT